MNKTEARIVNSLAGGGIVLIGSKKEKGIGLKMLHQIKQLKLKKTGDNYYLYFGLVYGKCDTEEEDQWFDEIADDLYESAMSQV